MIILKGGLCVDPESGMEAKKDIIIDGEIITAIEDDIDTDAWISGASDGVEVYDCNGLIIGPGIVDGHVHFRDPGFTYKEDIYSGAAAAAAGGVTSVILMANTKPVVDSVDTLKYVLDKGRETDIAVYSCASITKGLEGRELTDMENLKAHGAIAFTDDGIPILSENVISAAMQEAARLGVVLSFHEEDPKYIENNGINRGKASEHFGLGGSDRQAEISMVKRDIELAVKYGCKINIQHISTKEAVGLIREAKREGHGDLIFAEATPHHMSMTELDTIRYGTYAKMNPPLRTEEDRQAIIDGLADGTIDMIATDHAPHSDEEKNRPIDKAPSGIIGLETSLSVSYNTLIVSNMLSWVQLFCKLSLNPARIYGIDAGKLAIYRTADIVLFDPNMIQKFDKTRSKSFNSPLKNSEITGGVVGTIRAGRIIYDKMAKRRLT